MVTLNLENTKCKIIANLAEVKQIREAFKIKALNYFWASSWRERKWDGFVNYITEAGYFNIGLFPEVLEYIKANNWKVTINDNRNLIKLSNIVESFRGTELRNYQDAGLTALINNQYYGIPFNNGIFDHATNSGKTLLAAGLFMSLPKDKTLIFIVNRKHLYLQALEEMPKLVGKEVGYIGPTGIKWNRFMICSQQTLNSKFAQLSLNYQSFMYV